MRTGRFIVLLPVRDEADIIALCLVHLLHWADTVYVFDTGSVDDTWEIVQDFAAKEPRVKPLRKDPVFFSETRLRGWMFNHARQHMRDGDWFLRVDADEFHHVPPPEFVKTRMRKYETCAYHQYYNFCLLESEVASSDAHCGSSLDQGLPIFDRRRSYKVSVYSEPRLCRYRATMQWPPTVSFPFNAGFVARERLPIRHYPHRSPAQLERRCRLRAVMMADNENRQNWSRPELHHWAECEWRRFVTPDSDPELKHWKPGSELPEVRLIAHLAKPHIRLMQWVAHRFMLPILDARRAGWPADAYPQKIPDDVVARLEEELSQAQA
jgi:glycosyltransferase involved in cell wall biosynthesis